MINGENDMKRVRLLYMRMFSSTLWCACSSCTNAAIAAGVDLRSTACTTAEEPNGRYVSRCCEHVSRAVM